MKKEKWFSVKYILFTYLALNKVLYWFNTITELDQADFRNVAAVLLSRFLNQDLFLILGVIAFFFLNHKIEQKKTKSNAILEYVKFYAIGYVMILCILIVYFLLMFFISQAENFYFRDLVREFISIIPNLTAFYLVASVALEIKEFFKAKEKEGKEDTHQN